MKPLVDELTLRCDSPEKAAEYAGVGKSTFYRIRNGYNQTVNPETARLIILALFQRRKEDRRNGSSEVFRKALQHQVQMEDRAFRNIGY